VCFDQSFGFTIDDLESVQEIGSGTCGQVCKMKHKQTGHVLAVKASLTQNCFVPDKLHFTFGC